MDPHISPITKPAHNRHIPMAIAVISLVLIVIIGIYTVLSYRQKPAQTSQELAKQQDNKDTSFPRITVESWKIEKGVEIKTSATTASLYNLDTSYGRSEFNGLLFHFFAPTSTSESSQSLRAYSDRSGTSMFYMQKDTGSFLYKSTAGFPVATGSAALDETKRIVTFAQDALRDDTLASFATYEKRSTPGVVYYELHRDWNRLGFPLYNLFGLLNIKETSLSALSLHKSTNQAEPDTDIIKTSDDTVGLKRPNDFNTVTVGVKNGHIVNVISNLRLFPPSGRPATDKLISYDNAVKRLKNNQYARLYTSPAGEGVVDREKLYPQNKAAMTEATVAEAALAYLEELPGTEQEVLAPYYVFRGTGTLSSGYRVTFVATVPATSKNVLGVATVSQNSFDSSQKQGTLEFDEGPFPTTSPDPSQTPPGESNPTREPASRTQLPSAGEICDEGPQSINQLYNVQVDDTSGVTFGQFDLQPPPDVGRAGAATGWYGPQWFAVYRGSHDINQLNTVIDLATSKIGLKPDNPDTDSNITIREFDSLLNDWESAQVICPVRLTGRSPSVFVYSNSLRNVSIKLAGGVTYADPPAPKNSWHITTPANYLYYEYDRIVFNKPTTGWSVRKSELSQFSASVSSKLGLTQAESARLVFELKNAAQSINAAELFIGFISEAEISQKLPLTVVPTPESIRRIHFVLSEAAFGTPTQPILSPITRSSYTVVELGATD